MKKIIQARTFQGRLSYCHDAPVIKITLADDTALLYCDVCGKTCGFYKVSQFTNEKTKMNY